MPLMPAGRFVLFGEAIDGGADTRAPLSLALYKTTNRAVLAHGPKLGMLKRCQDGFWNGGPADFIGVLTGAGVRHPCNRSGTTRHIQWSPNLLQIIPFAYSLYKHDTLRHLARAALFSTSVAPCFPTVKLARSQMKRTAFLPTLTLIVLSVPAASSAQSALPTTQPSVLTIYREDIKFGHSAAHESTEAGWPLCGVSEQLSALPCRSQLPPAVLRIVSGCTCDGNVSATVTATAGATSWSTRM